MELPKRKHPRLKNYDYHCGYYFITICTQDNRPILSASVTADPPKLTPIGVIAEQQLFALEDRYDFVRIDKHMVMPTHIHAIVILGEKPVSSAPRPTLMDILCTYKSLTTRICNENDGTRGRKLFQSSFYETVIRNEKAYLEIWQYIQNNPTAWTQSPHFRKRGLR